MSHEEIIKTNYYNPKIGFQSASRLYEKLKHLGITKKEIQTFIQKQSTHQEHTQIPHIKHYHPIKSNFKNHIMQSDLIDVSDISKYNEGVKYLLVVIDVFSRYVYLHPLKTKNALTVTNAMQNILTEINPKPEIIMSDQGSEFISLSFGNLMKENNITHELRPVGDHKSLGVIDRFVRTLRELINKYLTSRKTNKYIDVLKDLVYNYNNSYHSGIF